jgi:hypothetical protein
MCAWDTRIRSGLGAGSGTQRRRDEAFDAEGQRTQVQSRAFEKTGSVRFESVDLKENRGAQARRHGARVGQSRTGRLAGGKTGRFQSRTYWCQKWSGAVQCSASSGKSRFTDSTRFRLVGSSPVLSISFSSRFASADISITFKMLQLLLADRLLTADQRHFGEEPTT